MHNAEDIRHALKSHTDTKKTLAELQRFFKTGPGEYAEGDVFFGVSLPNQRLIAKQASKTVPLSELALLLQSGIHEHRMTALLTMTYQYKAARTDGARKTIVDLYLASIDYINNWDLVDCSAHEIIGAWVFAHPSDLLTDLAHKNNLWSQRIAMVATWHFIRKGKLDETLKIAEILLHHRHDLIHKAVGWMLRETGKKDFKTLTGFIDTHYQTMPRTMLRYAIEKYPEDMRQKILRGE